ncbi:MAG TPA: LysR substrate-binding domain-containing protein [Clostridia bacterium]|nr:LysR substrate-binding domain-containing protein [Clostridia bacterium]
MQRLTDMSIDIGLVRSDSVIRPLKSKPVLTITYGLFLPAKMVTSVDTRDLRHSLANVPLAIPYMGQLREHVEMAAAKAGWPLRIELYCGSFMQAAWAVKSGASGAILPVVAAAEFGEEEVAQFPLPFLNSYIKPICIAWNPRLTEVRPGVAKAIAALEQVLATRQKKRR